MVATALRKDLQYGKVAAQEMKQSAHIPYLRHVEDTIVKTKQGFLVSVIKLSGLCFQTLDQSEINLRYHNRNTNIRGLGSSRFAIYGHVIRRAVAPEIAGEFENPFTRELDAI
jgi:type IV secretion system protein VirB4